MLKFMRTFALLALGALISVGAWASPQLLYEFRPTSSTFLTGPFASPGPTQYLNGFRMWLTPDALVEGEAALHIRSLREGPVSFTNEGFSRITFGFASMGEETGEVSLDPAFYSAGDGVRYFLDIDLTVDRMLGGSIDSNNDSEEVIMSTDRSFVVSRLSQESFNPWLKEPSTPDEWTGFLRSDAWGASIYVFTGEWRFVGLVPEPGTLALMLAALGGAALTARRRL